MSDDYICSVCGHRAGDHAVANRCLANDCDCKDDPYLEQLSALKAKLAIAVEALNYIPCIMVNDGRAWNVDVIEQRIQSIIDNALAKLEEK
jgi:hypothetical protein